MYEFERWTASILIVGLALLFVGWMARKLLIIFGMIALPVGRQKLRYHKYVATMPEQARQVRQRVHEQAQIEEAGSTLDDPGLTNEDEF